jgi:hypothetical protein
MAVSCNCSIPNGILKAPSECSNDMVFDRVIGIKILGRKVFYIRSLSGEHYLGKIISKKETEILVKTKNGMQLIEFNPIHQ